MSEHAPHHGPEIQLPSAEALEPHHHHEKDTAQASHEARQQAKEHESHARAAVEGLAVSGREMAPQHNEQHSGAHHRPAAATREIKAMALERTLKRAQRHLSAPDRAISKFMHQPAVNRASEAGGKTVARPSGILGGGTAAFLGSLILYVTSKRYGFEYNFAVLLVLFAGGFVLGMMIELGLYARRLNRRR